MASAGALVAFLAVQPALAFHDDSLPIVLAGDEINARWHSFRLNVTQASTIAVDVEAFNVSLPNQAGIFVYFANQTLDFGFTFTAVAQDSGVFVATNLIDTEPIELQVPTSPGGTLQAGVTMAREPGVFYVVLWEAGVQSHWTHALRADGNAIVEAEASGSNVFIHSAKDFGGHVNVQLYPGGIGGHAQVATDKIIQVDGSLLAVFYPVFLTGRHVMTVTTPSSDEVCSCFFEHVAGPSAHGPGTYTFHLTGAGVGFSGLDDVVLGGADVRLPLPISENAKNPHR